MKKFKQLNSRTFFSKCISYAAAGALLAGCLAGCASGNGQTASGARSDSDINVPSVDASQKEADAGLQIVTTIFPEYDWVREILGENPGNAEVTMLLDNGVDLHSYQPTAQDILKISTCDLFVYVGGESDEWVEDALEEATNKDMIVINLLEELGESVKEEEIVEGMEHDHDHEHSEVEHEDDHDEDREGKHDEDHDHEHEEGEVEYDEHVWLSLKNASVLCDSIKDALTKLDAANAAVYEANAESYKKQLAALDADYQAAVKSAAVKTVLFGDRFPFRYMTDDYGLSYYAAFAGCSAETEASFETIIFLANKVDELGLPTILKIESGDGKIAETIKNNTKTKDQKILTMDSMQSTTSKDVAAGKTYAGIMTENLQVLREALNQ